MEAQTYQSTRIERIVEKELKDLGIAFEAQRWIKQLTRPDFYIKPKIAVYVDGDYWHSLPDIKLRDKNINAKLEKMGYKVIRFSEDQILNNIDTVKETLKELQYGEGS